MTVSIYFGLVNIIVHSTVTHKQLKHELFNLYVLPIQHNILTDYLTVTN